MKICKIWDADYPWDIRVEKVANALSAAGHTVHLLCRNLARRRTYEWNGSFAIHRLPPPPALFGPAHTLWNFPYPINPVWIRAIGKAIHELQPDLILVRDLPLALPAAILGKAYRLPIILDMAENYPAMLRDRLLYDPLGLLGRLIRRPAPARLIERLTVRLVDHIIVVVEEARERLLQAGIEPDRVTIVSNTPILDQWQPRKNLPSPSDFNGCTNLVYLGNLDGMRGIDVAIRAVRYLKDLGHVASLSVIGDGHAMQQLRELALQLGLSDRVTFMGYLSLRTKDTYSRVQSVMAQSHVGLIPHYATDACNNTVPNKLFDYMLLGLPVIVSDTKPMARIVRAEGCGEIFRDRDVVDLARCVIALGDPHVRRQMGDRGQAAIHKRYNWSHDSKVLIQVMESVRSQRAEMESHRRVKFRW